jgi:hypothetical protein
VANIRRTVQHIIGSWIRRAVRDLGGSNDGLGRWFVVLVLLLVPRSCKLFPSRTGVLNVGQVPLEEEVKTFEGLRIDDPLPLLEFLLHEGHDSGRLYHGLLQEIKACPLS